MDILGQIVRGRDPSFGEVEPRQIDEHLRRLDDLARAEDKEAFLLAAMRLFALAGNGHTRIIPNPAINAAPLRFVCLGDAYWLTAAPAEYAEFIDCRLTQVNGHPLEHLMGQFAPLLAGTPARRQAIGNIMLAWPAALATVGASGDRNSIRYEFDCNAGSVRTVEVRIDDAHSAQALYPTWETGFLQPGCDDYAPRTVGRDHADANRRPIRLRLRDFAPSPEGEVETHIARARQAVLDDPQAGLIIDCRGNPGGDFLKTLPLVTTLRNAWRGSACIALVDKFTFSAAIVFVALLKAHLADRVRIVGEPMGDRTRFFAEGDTIELPATKALVRYSTGFHDWQTGSPTPLTPPEIAEHMIAAGDLCPDIVVRSTAPQVRSGDDPVLATALGLLD